MDATNAIASTLYRSPIPETSNVRYVENRIIINAPHQVVYDYATTWTNLPNWLPVAKTVYVQEGDHNSPAKLGDVLGEAVHQETDFVAAATKADKIYTVVVRVPGLLWTIAGVDDVGDPWVGKTVTFVTASLSDGTTLFTRVFQQVRKEGDDAAARHPVLQPQVMQKGLERLKELVESERKVAESQTAAGGLWRYVSWPFTACLSRRKSIQLK